MENITNFVKKVFNTKNNIVFHSKNKLKLKE